MISLVPSSVFGSHESTEHIDIKDFFEVIHVGVQRRGGNIAADASIAEHDVELSVLINSKVDSVRDVGFISDITMEIGNVVVGGIIELLAEGSGEVVLDVSDHHFGSILHEKPHGRRADPARSAGDQSDFSGQSATENRDDSTRDRVDISLILMGILCTFWRWLQKRHWRSFWWIEVEEEDEGLFLQAYICLFL